MVTSPRHYALRWRRRPETVFDRANKVNACARPIAARSSGLVGGAYFNSTWVVVRFGEFWNEKKINKHPRRLLQKKVKKTTKKVRRDEKKTPDRAARRERILIIFSTFVFHFPPAVIAHSVYTQQSQNIVIPTLEYRAAEGDGGSDGGGLKPGGAALSFRDWRLDDTQKTKRTYTILYILHVQHSNPAVARVNILIYYVY